MHICKASCKVFVNFRDFVSNVLRVSCKGFLDFITLKAVFLEPVVKVFVHFTDFVGSFCRVSFFKFS